MPPPPNQLYFHYADWNHSTPEQIANEKDVADAERKTKKEQRHATRQAKNDAEKAAKHAANLERFREEIRLSNRSDEEKASLIEKSYKW